MSISSWLRGLFRPSEDERDLAAEATFHMEQETARNIRFGMTPEDARLQATRSFGGVDRYQEEAHDVRGTRWMEELSQDVRFSLRMLRRTPVFTAVAVLSLAIGIGANTAVFSVVRSVLLRPLPYPSSEQLAHVYISATERPDTRGSLSFADFVELKKNPDFAAIGALQRLQGGVALSGMGDAEQVPSSLATSGIFPALGVQPLIGRWILPADDEPAAAGVALLQYEYWQQRFGGERNVVGRTIEVDGSPTVVIGVMPKGFRIPGSPDDRMWLSNQMRAPRARAPFMLTAVARVRPSLPATRVSADLERAAASVKATWPDSPRQWHYAFTPLKDSLVRDTRATLLLLFGAVGLVLLIATANLANLLLARATTRASELALRASLGAGRLRLVRQLLTESVVIAGMGSMIGLLLAYWGVRSASALRIDGMRRLEEVSLDGGVLGYTFVLALLVGIATGLVPAIRLSRADLAVSLREGARALGSRGSARLRAALVSLEFALALLVVVGAGLLIGSLMRLQQVDSGINVSDVLSVRVSPPSGRYQDGPQLAGFYDALTERLQQLPGVTAVGISMAVPPDRLIMRNPFTPEGKTYTPDQEPPLAEELIVSPGYFSAFGIPLLSGRPFTEMDRDSAPPVTMINETMAKRWFGSADAAVGRWIQTGQPDPQSTKLAIVGVVRDVKYSGLDAPPEPTIYVPFRQNTWWPAMYVTMQSDRRATELMPGVRDALRAVDPNVPVVESLTLADLRGSAVAAPRFRAVLLGMFAMLALMLATAGIYGVMSYSVSQRQQETSVRIALGARPADIVRRTLREGLLIAAVGIVGGLAGAVALTRVTTSLLFDTAALDVRTFLLTSVLLVTVALVACAVPAIRAARTDPARAFRGE